MMSIPAQLLFAAAVALSCIGCRTAAPGFCKIQDSELSPHRPTGLALPEKVGSFQRIFAKQGEEDPGNIRLGYSHGRRPSPHLVIITVEPSALSPSERIQSQKESFMAAHQGAVVADTGTNGLPVPLRDWETVVIDYHGFVADFPPSMRHQPRRVLYAARKYHGHSLLLSTTPFYKEFGPVFFPATADLVRDLFPEKQ